MLVSRGNENITLHEHYAALMKMIHEPLQTLEERMLAGYSDEITILKIRPEYAAHLANTVKVLRSISANLFLNVNLEHVASYQSYEMIPAEYQAYLRANENLTSFVQASIFCTNQVSLSLLAMERWIYILKQSYESGDFFTAGAIVCALSRLEVARTDLHLYISNTAKGILEYYQPIFNTLHRVHTLQVERSCNGAAVLPQLSAFAGVDGKTSDLSCEYAKMKRLINQDIMLSGETLRQFLISSWGDKQIALVANNAESISYALKDKDAKPKVDMNVLSMVFKFYDETDTYYAGKRALLSSINKLNDAALDISNKLKNKCIAFTVEILKNPSYTTRAKYDYMLCMMNGTIGNFETKFIKMFEAIKNELQLLFRFDNKFLDLEPDIKYTELKTDHAGLWSRLSESSSDDEPQLGRQFTFFAKNPLNDNRRVHSSIDRPSSFTMGYKAGSGDRNQ